MSRTITRMSPQESDAWLALIATAELLPAALDAQLQRDAGITHYEFMVLTSLQQLGALRLGDLAAATNATLPRASKVVTRMQQRGLVERTTASDDRRAIAITLTGAGRRALVLATPGHLETVRALVLDRLSPEQLWALSDALEPVVATLDPHDRFSTRRENAAPRAAGHQIETRSSGASHSASASVTPNAS